MSVFTVAGILKAIPWKEIFEHGPTLIESAKRAFKRSKEPNPRETLQERVEWLEKNEKEQAKLIQQLVERQELLVTTIKVISLRLKALFVCTLGALAGLVTCLWILFFR